MYSLIKKQILKKHKYFGKYISKSTAFMQKIHLFLLVNRYLNLLLAQWYLLTVPHQQNNQLLLYATDKDAFKLALKLFRPSPIKIDKIIVSKTDARSFITSVQRRILLFWHGTSHRHSHSIFLRRWTKQIKQISICTSMKIQRSQFMQMFHRQPSACTLILDFIFVRLSEYQEALYEHHVEG